MEAASSVVESGVHLPAYELISGDLLRQIEHASSVVTTSTDELGEFYAKAMAVSVTATLVVDSSIIIVPLSPPGDNEQIDFTFLAGSKLMFVKLHDTPQPRMTYGHVASYSAGTVVKPFQVGTLVKFASPINFVVAKQRLVMAISNAAGAEIDLRSETVQPGIKRACIRQLETGGELVEDAGEKLKGTFTYLLDLDGVKHMTRNKTEIPQRERDLYFLFRAMDNRRWDYSISTDLVLQTELYRSMVCEQGDTQSEDRHMAFESCGLISRVQKLRLFQEKDKLKLLLTGSVLVECTTDPTLTLQDFAIEEKISNKTTACPSNNIGIIQAIKNFQIVMQIIFSDAFAQCLSIFIDKLEGVSRPMEVVAADFLRYSIELTLRKFFRVVRSVKSTAFPDYSLHTPELCATFLTALFGKLVVDLSDPPTMMRQEAYYRFRLARSSEMAATVTPLKTKLPGDKTKEEPKAAQLKPCSAHLGFQLSAVRKDGRPYTCSHGKDCTYRHISILGKSNQKLIDLTASMPPTIRAELRKAIDGRK